MQIDVDKILVDNDIQSRAEIDFFRVDEYAADMQKGDKFPPVIVFNDGDNYWLADGFHRFYAVEKLNINSIDVELKSGTKRDAILFSVGANANHGLRRSNKDKRRAVFRLLEDEEWSQMPDSAIAKYCKVTQAFVYNLRKELDIIKQGDIANQLTRHGDNIVTDDRLIVYTSGPEEIKQLVAYGEMSARRGADITRLLKMFPQSDTDVIVKICGDSVEKIEILYNLYSSKQKCDNIVYSEIIDLDSGLYKNNRIDFRALTLPDTNEVISDRIEHHRQNILIRQRDNEIAARQVEAQKLYIPNKFRDYICGNCLDILPQLEDKSVKLLLTDPPYGISFESNRRTITAKSGKILGDATLEESLLLLGKMLSAIDSKMSDNSRLVLFTSQKGYIDFIKVVESHGYTIGRTLTWVKENHTSGNLNDIAPRSEWIINAWRGRPSINKRIDDILEFKRTRASSHPAEKPIGLLKAIISVFTIQGELVVDPFCGSGSTVIASRLLQRKSIGIESERKWYDEGIIRLSK